MTADILRGLAQVIHVIIQAYILIIVVRSLLSWMGNLPPHPLVHLLRRLTDPAFRLAYRVLPSQLTMVGNIDISPIIIIVALYLVDSLVARLMIGYTY